MLKLFDWIDFMSPMSLIWLLLLILGVVTVGWLLLFFISIALPLMFGRQGIILRVRLQLFLGLYSGRNSIAPSFGGNYVGLVRLSTALRAAIPDLDRETFEKYVAFLTKAGDLHQVSSTWYFKAFLIALSIFEMVAYSLSLAPSMGDMNASEKYAVGSTIAFTLGLMFYILMHAGGVSAARSRSTKELFNEYREDPNRLRGSFPSRPDILPSHNQSMDNGDPSWKQGARRVTHSKGYFFYWSVAALVAFATISMGVRFGNLVTDKRETTSLSQPADGIFMANDLGAIDPASPKANDASFTPTKPSNNMWENWIFFIAITFVFVVTQGVSILMGHQGAFASENSKEPSKQIAHNYDWGSYLQYKRTFIHQADELLQEWIVKSGVGISDDHKTKMEHFYPEMLQGQVFIGYSKPTVDSEQHKITDV